MDSDNNRWSKNIKKIIERAQINQTPEKKEEVAPQKATEKKLKILKKQEDLTKVGYVAKPLVVCSIPCGKQNEKIMWERENGRSILELRITKPERYVLPYGRDRHFLFWIKKQVTLRKSREIKFSDYTDILSELGYEKNGVNVQWLKEAMLRCHHTLLYYIETDEKDFTMTSRGELIIPYMKVSKRGRGTFVVGEQFSEFLYQKIDLNVVENLGRNYIGIDLYTFMLERQSRAKDFVRIPIYDLRSNFGMSSETPDFKYKQQILAALESVREAGYDSGCVIDDSVLVMPPKKIG